VATRHTFWSPAGPASGYPLLSCGYQQSSEAHWASHSQVAPNWWSPVPVQPPPEQTPPVQVPAQQSPLTAHSPPAGAHMVPPQMPPMQVSPLQQSFSAAQDWPGGWQQALVLVLARPWRLPVWAPPLTYQHL